MAAVIECEVAISDADEIKWFNAEAFGPAPEDRRGNAPVGIIEGPGRHTWDLSFRKKVRIAGRSKVGVQADVFNLANRRVSAIDYYYTSRLNGEAAAGVADKHFHPIESRSVRVVLNARF